MTSKASHHIDSVRRLRIAHVVPQLNMGGLERLQVDFARHIDRSQFDLQFVSLSDRGTLAAEIEHEGWPVTAYRMRPGLRPSYILRLANFFRKSNIDVVHTHNTKALFYAAPAAKLAGVHKIIHTRHGQCFNSTRWTVLGFRHACRLVDHVVCVSEDISRLSCQSGVPVNKIIMIPNAIDTSRFAFVGPQSRGPITMVGRLSPEKNVQLLLKAFAIALREEPQLNLEIVGDGPCRSELDALSRQLGIAQRVLFAGETRVVAPFLRRASMFVLPSLTEGISLTLLEAMAVGLPTIATNVGGSAEVVVDQSTGVLVSSDNSQELAEAILRMWHCPQIAQRMGECGRARIEEYFDLHRMLRRYEDLYRVSQSTELAAAG